MPDCFIFFIAKDDNNTYHGKKMKRRLFFIWLISYGLIFLIPLTGIFLSFHQANRVIEEEISRSHWASLNQIRHIVDGELDGVDRLALEIGWSPLVERLMAVEEPVDEWDRFNLFQFHRNARVYASVSNMVDDFFLYLPSTGMVVTHMNMYSSLDEYHRLFLESHSLGELNREFSQYSNGRIISLEENSDSETDYYWIRSFPTGRDDEILGQLVLRLNRNHIRSILAENSWMPSAVLGIADNPGRPILYEPREMGFSQPLSLARRGSVPLEIEGVEYMLSLIPSEKCPWSYFSLIPTNLFLERAKNIRLTIILFSGAAYMIAFFMLLYMIDRNYRPIGTLVSHLDQMPKDTDNELEFISRSMNQLLQEQDRQSRSAFLYRLLNRPLKSVSILEEGIDKYRLDWENRCFQTALIYVENLGDEEPDPLSFEFLIEAVKQAFSSLECDLIDQRGELTLLLRYQKRENRTAVTTAARQLHRSLSENYGLSSAVALSSVKDSALYLFQAHQEARESLEAALFRGTREVVFFEDLKGERDVSRPSSLELENRFLNALRANQISTARQILLDELIRIGNEKGDYWINKTRVMGITSLVIDAFGELRGVLTDDYSREVERLCAGDNLGEIHRRIEGLFLSLERDIEKDREAGDDSLVKQTDRYLIRNFADISLTVSSIAEYLGVSDTYLSTLYKKETGRGLLRSIHNTRIREAKKLLRSTPLTLNDIAGKIGYSNDIALIRAFKRYEGISPGKYRDSVKK